MPSRFRRSRTLLGCAAAIAIALASLDGAAQVGDHRSQDTAPRDAAEFHFARMIYTDLPEYRRRYAGWWSQDMPDAETHFKEGVQRLTRIDVGDPRTVDLMDEHLFEYPWLYATQVGYWDLSDSELARLREYLARGGFLIVDDFFGDYEWQVFQETMTRLYPDRPIIEIQPGMDDEIFHVVYELDQSTQIPGLRHLRSCGGFGRGFGRGFRRGFGRGSATAQLPEPHWRGIFDDDGRLMIAINYNMDVGDAWEEADNPCYPEPMTALAYRFAINYLVYAMTH